jgi:hypothetical protein
MSLPRIAHVLAAAVALVGTACARDVNKDVLEALGELDSFTTTLTDKVKSGATPIAGVEDAQRFFDEKSKALLPRVMRIRKAEQSQVSPETWRKLTESTVTNVAKVNMLQLSFALKGVRDQALDQKLAKLVADYNAMVGGS